MVYNDGELELKVSVDSETIWLTQLQMSQLFDTSTDNVGLHLKNIYLEKELDENSTTEFFSVVRKEGNRLVKRELKHYNLDVIICVGYRVSSLRATKFRQWATSVLKNYIQNGYAINGEKITNDRFVSLENDVNILKSQINKINSKIKENSLEFNQNIFFDGQIYDAYSFVNDLLKLANSEIILIDNYIDDTVFTLFSKYPNINFTIYTSKISIQLSLDFEKYSKQYKNISLKTFKNSHDRFLIIDKKEIYHLGASLKDLGKKWFAFSKMSLDSLNLDEILYKLEVYKKAFDKL
ncbi:RhuM family protein [Aliarcobacter cryaerophilus]|uniref:RhuM family protein n=1 Tax=Aliarcobacter cryaerophilus TaxID=28198 RepID=UPI001D180DCA|nr:RhuM family protein [Aliarcobacter cryaerophilus]